MPVPTFSPLLPTAIWPLGYFVRDQGALSLEAAIKKITADTARIWGSRGGAVGPGFAGDVAIFDAKEIDRCAEEARFDMLKGMRYVRASGAWWVLRTAR